MEHLSKVVDALRVAIYEIFATLLPGSIVAAPLWASLAKASGLEGGDGLGLLVLSLVAGLALQGIASLIFRRFARQRTRPQATEDLLALCRERLPSTLKKDVTDDVVFSYALAALGADRGEYDKFLALRDGARGLSIALPLGLVELALRVRPAWGPGLWTVAGLCVTLASIGFVERWARFRDLPTTIVYSKFLAQALREK